MTLGCVETIAGLWDMSWPTCLPFRRDGYTRFAGFLFGSFALVWLLGQLLRVKPWAAGTAICLGIIAYDGAWWPVAWISAVAIAAAMLGDLALQHVRWRDDCFGCHALVSLALGAIVFGTGIELTASLPVHTPFTYSIAVFGIIFVRRKRLTELLRQWLRAPSLDSGRTEVAACLTAALCVLYFAVALLPEFGHDGLAFHLLIPCELRREAFWHFDVTHVVGAVTPKQANWLFSVGYMLAGETGARLVNFGFVLASSAVISRIGEKLAGGSSSLPGSLSSALFLSWPLTFLEGSVLFADALLAFLVLVAWLVLLRGLGAESKSGILVVFCALLCGSIATKPQGWVCSGVMAVVALPIVARLIDRIRLVDCLWIAGFITFVAIPPYLRAWLMTGNPFFPFFNGFFRSDYFPHSNFQDAWRSSIGWNILSTLTFDSSRYIEGKPGSAGFQWLLLLPAAVAGIVVAGNRAAIWTLLLAITMTSAMLLGSRYLRYVYPALALLLPVISTAICSFGRGLRRGALAVYAGCVALNLAFFASASWRFADFPMHALGNLENRKRLIEELVPIRSAIDLVNVVNRDSRPVAFFCHPFGAGLNGPALYSNWYNDSFASAINGAGSPAELCQVLCNRDVLYIILDGSWGDHSFRARVREVSTLVSSFGGLEVRFVGQDCCLSPEVLSDLDFRLGLWTHDAGSATCGTVGGIEVTVDRPATQVIPARPGFRYVLTAHASSANSPVPCRTQVNWLDANGLLVRADIEVFEVDMHGSYHSMARVVPVEAQSGVVYATSHNSTPVCFESISFKWGTAASTSASRQGSDR